MMFEEQILYSSVARVGMDGTKGMWGIVYKIALFFVLGLSRTLRSSSLSVKVLGSDFRSRRNLSLLDPSMV